MEPLQSSSRTCAYTSAAHHQTCAACASVSVAGGACSVGALRTTPTVGVSRDCAVWSSVGRGREPLRATMATSGVCDSRGAAGSATATHTPVSLQDLDPDTMLRVASLLDAPDVAHCVGVRKPTHQCVLWPWIVLDLTCTHNRLPSSFVTRALAMTCGSRCYGGGINRALTRSPQCMARVASTCEFSASQRVSARCTCWLTHARRLPQYGRPHA